MYVADGAKKKKEKFGYFGVRLKLSPSQRVKKLKTVKALKKLFPWKKKNRWMDGWTDRLTEGRGSD